MSEFDFENEKEEDLEYSENDFINEDDAEGESDIDETFILPFNSMFCYKLPEKFNPVSLFKNNKEVTLYNPNNRLQPYSKIAINAITLESLRDNFIVSDFSYKESASHTSLSSYANILNSFKTIMNDYINFSAPKEPEFNNANKNKNTNGNKFSPKPSQRKFNKKNQKNYPK